MLAAIIHYIFLIYTVMLFIRVLSSWIPEFQSTKFIRFISFYTDPFLNLFRRFIPPLGGMIDISPILAFFSLQIAEFLIMSIF